MPDDIESKLIDKRVVQRYLRKGRVDEKDYDRYLKSLPDLAEQAVPVESDLDQDGDEAGAGAAGPEAKQEG
jgi:pantothenate kinase